MLTDKSVSNIAGIAGVNGKAIRRLTGSVKVRIAKPGFELVEDKNGISRPQQNSEVYDIGLRLNIKENFRMMSNVQMESLIADLVIEYRKSCPVVCGWAGRGDFSTDKLPENLNRGNVLHASRTAGRIRARAFRQSAVL